MDIKLFHAPYPFGFLQQLSVYMHEHTLLKSLDLIYSYFLSNLDRYFLSVTYDDIKFVFYYKYFFIIILFAGFYYSHKSKERSILAASLIYFAVIFALLALYDAYDWREVRMLTAPFVILTVILVLNKKYTPVVFIVLFQLLMLYPVLDSQQAVNDRRVQMNHLIKEYRPMQEDFKGLKKHLSVIKKKEVLVLLNAKLFSLDNSPIFYQLPLKLDGKYIRYSFIFPNLFNIASSKSDIFISDKPEHINTMKLIGHNKNYYFYERKD
jgi:hypothetical protein